MYTKELLIEELRYFAEYLNRVPTSKDLVDPLMPSLVTYIRYFGSWNNALKEADFPIYKEQPTYNKEQLISNLINNKITKVSELTKPSISAYTKQFGSWSNALKEANIPLNKFNDITNKELLSILRTFGKRTPKYAEIKNAEHIPSIDLYIKRFGSYTNACIKAGLKPNCNQSHITEENLALSYNKEWLSKENETKTLHEISNDLGYNNHRMSSRFKELGIKPNYSLTSSLKEKEWLDSLGITERQYPIANYKVDGYDPETNTVYEFLGDYWHGNPEVYDPDDYNKSCSKTFGQLFDETNIRLEHIKSLGYNIITKWENDILQLEESVKIK